MSTQLILAMCGGCAFGVLVAFLNSRLTKMVMFHEKATGIMIVNFVRFGIDVIALALGLVFCKTTGISVAPVLLAIAIGLTVGGTLFLLKLTKMPSPGASGQHHGSDKAAASEKSAEQERGD